MLQLGNFSWFSEQTGLCSLTPSWTMGVNLTSWSRTFILLQAGQPLQEEQSEHSSSKPRHWWGEGGEKCNGLCSFCLLAKSGGWFLCLWHMFSAAGIELEKGRPRAILLSVASAMNSNCKTWTQCPSWVTESKLGLSAKAVIPSATVFPLPNELWDNSLVILSTSALATCRKFLPARWVLKIIDLKQKTQVLSQKQTKKENP